MVISDSGNNEQMRLQLMGLVRIDVNLALKLHVSMRRSGMAMSAQNLLTICWSLFFVNVADADDVVVVEVVLLLITFVRFVALTTDVDISL